MLALHRAGLLRFLGPGLSVTADESTGEFVAASPQAGFAVRTAAFIEARLPATSVARSAQPAAGVAARRPGWEANSSLLTADGIHSTGKLLVSDRARTAVTGTAGTPQGRLFGVGPGTSGWGAGAFARPGHQRRPLPRERRPGHGVILGVAAEAGFVPAPPRQRRNVLEPAAVGRGLNNERENQPPRQPGGTDPGRPRAGAAEPGGTEPVRTKPAALTVLNLPMHDPRVRPLLDELAVEYDSRYGDLFGRGAAADELNRYPASEFKGPGGALLVVQENGESIAGGAFRRYDNETAEFKRIWTHSAHRRRGLARFVLAELDGPGGPPGLPARLPDHRSAPARSQAPVPDLGL